MQVHDKNFVRFIHRDKIEEELDWMGRKISMEYKDKNPIFLAVLNGAFIFAADLYRKVTCDSSISFIKLASYEGTQSSGKIREVIGLTEDIKGRHVVILEDIVDTGRSMRHLIDTLKEQEPASIKIATLLVKPDALEEPVEIAYRAFDIPNLFVIGYGLDYNGLGRQLPDIYQLSN